MNIMNFFNWSYWFYQPFIARGNTVWIWVFIFLFSVLVGLVLKFIAQSNKAKYIKKIFNSFANAGLIAGLLGLLWLFFRQERVPFLAWRFWLLLIFVGVFYVVAKNLYFIIKRLPKIKAEKAEKIIKDKYSPKK